jgi:hypothetical protein
MLNFSEFPAPFDAELPYHLHKGRGRLTMTGNALLDYTLERDPAAQDPNSWFWRAMKELPEWDQTFIVAFNRRLAEAYDAKIERDEGVTNLLRDVGRIYARAKELDPSLAAEGESFTLGEAVEVLKRHGEPLGVSEEVLEMEFDMNSGDLL